MYQIYHFDDKVGDLINSVRKFDFSRGLPGGWLNYGPPREVIGYGDGSLYTDDGEKYGKKWNQTSWAGSVPATNTTAVVKTDPIPDHFIKTGILKEVRKAVEYFGGEVDDSTGTGIWCNYYNKPNDLIAGHTDDEDYYQRNFENEPLFVSLTLYEDEDIGYHDLARFQIKDGKSWKSIEMPHLSLLVMSGGVEHRVLKYIGNNFRKRYNITFRTPVKREDDIIKNYRFFSNFGRYYRKTYMLFVPKKCFRNKIPEGETVYVTKKNISIDMNGDIYPMISDGSYYQKVLEAHSIFNNRLIIKVNPQINRKELFQEIRMKYGENIKSPPITTTAVSMMLLLND